MKEKYIEQKLVNEVKKHGGVCLKLASTGLDGIPDRLVLMSKGKIAFVELNDVRIDIWTHLMRKCTIELCTPI